jgi:hypothetical protein
MILKVSWCGLSMPLRRISNGLPLAWTAGLLLPLVGVLFWLTTVLIEQRVLSQSHTTTAQLQAAGQHQVNLSFSLTIASIDAEINRSTQLTEVSVRTIGSPLEEMEFKFPVTDFAEVEMAIAQELNLSPTVVRQLIRYRIDE